MPSAAASSAEHGFRVAQFLNGGDHRKHDLKFVAGGGAEQRAELRSQDLGAVESDADAALAQERIILARDRNVRERLSPPTSSVRMMTGICGPVARRMAV
jgi:hypothetical protein